MGTTLYNKIPLGRTPLLSSLLGSRKGQAALAFGMLAGAGILWAAVRVLH
jgi:hypothetical protein